PDVCRFGIDIFETYTALAKGYKIKQALLGVKNHDAKDPSSQLASMFRQVINVMFTSIECYESVWKSIEGVSATELLGDVKSNFTAEQIQVSLPSTIEAFKNNYSSYVDIYKSFLEPEIISKFEQLRQIDTVDIDFPSEIWAKTVYSFIAEFHKNPVYGKEKLIDALRVLWIGRIAVFLKETWTESEEASEYRVVEEARTFEKLKHYLIDKY
ncbi:MAG TPA: hypothetical protein VF350_00980, partial [Candidatus Bathyarchaeia archaeon]